MIHISRMRRNETAFTHLNTQTGETIHIAVDRLNRYIQGMENYKRKLTFEKWVIRQICEKNGIEEHRINRLMDHVNKQLQKGKDVFFDPVLCIDWEDGQQTLVDGSHRVAVAAEFANIVEGKNRSIKKGQYPDSIELIGYLIPKKLWTRFQIEGLPDATEEKLANAYSGIP